MNKEDIIRMAREADLIYWRPNSRFSDGVWWMDAGEPGDELERFAALVAAHEREACAKLCEEGGRDESGRIHVQAWGCAKAIRARGQE